MLIDKAKIYVKAGSGGNGCTSFYRDRKVRKGKPNGGHGGRGGNVIFRADNNQRTLLDFQYNRHFSAGRGGHGGSNNKNGKRGEDLCIKVPPGTIIRDAETQLELRDLSYDGEDIIVALGGEGGKGNTKYRDATAGDPGEEKNLYLELKLIADVGIIGYPNAGKSTLISRISRAKSKVANYPFTTKEPVLGIVVIDDTDVAFCDMPGLIEGAHSGRGLGDEFLRHIERTKLLLHVIDIAEVDGRRAYDDYLLINKELELYGKKVSKKPQVVASNKMDLPGADRKLSVFREKVNVEVFPISAVTGEGVGNLLSEIKRKLDI